MKNMGEIIYLKDNIETFVHFWKRDLYRLEHKKEQFVCPKCETGSTNDLIRCKICHCVFMPRLYQIEEIRKNIERGEGFLLMAKPDKSWVEWAEGVVYGNDDS